MPAIDHAAALARTRSRIKLNRAKTGRRPPKGRVRRLRHPRGQEVRYRSALLSIVRRLHEQVRSAMLPIIEAAPERADSLDRADSIASDIRAAARRIRRRLTSTILSKKSLNKIARAVALDVSRFSTGQMDLLFKSSLGIGLPPGSQELAPLIEAFTRDNVALITRMGKQEIARAESVVLSGFRAGQNNVTMAKALKARLGVSERRARLIARDQTGSLNAEITQVHNLRMGVKEFKWRTVGDERVRDLHRSINGKVYSVATGHPTEGQPSEPINCRCSAEPVLDDLFAGL